MIIPLMFFLVFVAVFGIYSWFVLRSLHEYRYAGDFSKTMSVIYLTTGIVIIVATLVWFFGSALARSTPPSPAQSEPSSLYQMESR